MNSKPEFTVIHASAGTGKTYHLIEKFKKITENFLDPSIFKKILAITFTEEAANEIKDRILKSFSKKLSQMRNSKEKIELENSLLQLRISTIHSFCAEILRRFLIEKGVDPLFEIIDDDESQILLNETFGKILKEDYDLVKQLMRKFNLKKIFSFLNSLHNKHPHTILYSPQLYPDSEYKEFSKIFLKLYNKLKETFKKTKLEKNYLDFDDLEEYSYHILKENYYEFLNILFDFDQHLNYILIDEFQDTNILQWEIIKSIITDWFSGETSKTELNQNFGIFIVGDRKQSIYMFRGAEPDVFDEVDNFSKNYKIQVKQKKLEKNHRSCKTIINFVNSVFNDDIWKKERLLWNEKIKEGLVEIFLFENATKYDESDWICRRIFHLINQKGINFKDIAILIRTRTDLGILEEKLRQYNIPFVTIKGIGFYNEEEILPLTSLVLSISDPSDELSLWILKNSKLNYENLTLEEILKKVKSWHSQLTNKEFSILLEEIIIESCYLQGFNKQQIANVEKFISIIQQYDYLTPFEIGSILRNRMENEKEPKADMFSEKENAVRILTIHSSKGLDFDYVFVYGVERINPNLKNINVIHKKEQGKYDLLCVWGEDKRKNIDGWNDFINLITNEEKRILYVSITRAKKGIIITGIKHKRDSMAVKILEKFKNNQIDFKQYPSLDFNYQIKPLDEKIINDYTQRNIPPPLVISSFTKEKKHTFDEEGGGETEEGDVVVGEVIHKILKLISERKLECDFKSINSKLHLLLKTLTFSDEIIKLKEIVVLNQIKTTLNNSSIKQIILDENGYSELQFFVEYNEKIFQGFIDRLIIKDDVAYIYDYKTHKSKSNLVEIYKEQLDIYAKAVEKIFKPKEIKKFLILTHFGEILDLG